MLISCPECGKEVSDKSEICVNCGYPIKKYIEDKQLEEIEYECPYCGSNDIDENGYCNKCKINAETNRQKGFIDEIADFLVGIFGQEPFEEKEIEIPKAVPKKIEKKKEFNGIYKYTFWGDKKEVYCPRCNSENCSHYKQEHVTPAKTKTSYSLNINPLKPLTAFNKKEKVIRKEQTYTENKIICNDCGYTFY